MEKSFYIIMGRSGSGKGTQADLLKKALEERGPPAGGVLHVTTGGGFREFVQGNTYIAGLARKVNEEGGLQPEFLAVWNWSNIFINTLRGEETIILDGAPRKPFEVHVLHSCIQFLGYGKPTIIYLNVSEGWAKERLLARGRDDDKNVADVERRLSWFETEVLPSIDVYRHDPRYEFVHVNGEQTVEEVHAELIKKLDEAGH
jgi:adenylate kinase family enzyme